MKKYLLAQTILIAGGTVYSWSRVVIQFQTFYQKYGTIFRIKDCTYPNPVVTACFYGAVAFAAALIWSINIYIKKEFDLKLERYLRNFLLFGVFFAASVLAFEFLLYYKIYRPAGPIIACSPGVFPLKTPCFYGMLTFLAAFLLSYYIIRHDNTRTETPANP
jgi:hypothetical protein